MESEKFASYGGKGERVAQDAVRALFRFCDWIRENVLKIFMDCALLTCALLLSYRSSFFIYDIEDIL